MSRRSRIIPLAEADDLPLFQRPVGMLLLMAAAMPVAYATWAALLNNFVIEAAGFRGVEIGWLHTVREIPGLLAIGVIAVLLVVREQLLVVIALGLLGVATAMTAWFPSFGGLLFVTLLSSVVSRFWWKFPGGVLRACEVASGQAARSRELREIG